EMLFDTKAPEMTQRPGNGTGHEVHGPCRGGEPVAGADPEYTSQLKHGHEAEIGSINRHDAQAPPEIEIAQVQVAGSVDLAQHQGGDQKAAQDKENLHAEEPAPATEHAQRQELVAGKAAVGEDHKQYGQRSQTVQAWDPAASQPNRTYGRVRCPK